MTTREVCRRQTRLYVLKAEAASLEQKLNMVDEWIDRLNKISGWNQYKHGPSELDIARREFRDALLPMWGGLQIAAVDKKWITMEWPSDRVAGNGSRLIRYNRSNGVREGVRESSLRVPRAGRKDYPRIDPKAAAKTWREWKATLESIGINLVTALKETQ